MSEKYVSREKFSEISGLEEKELVKLLESGVLPDHAKGIEMGRALKALANFAASSQSGKKTISELNREILEARLKKTKAETERIESPDTFNLTRAAELLDKKTDTLKKWIAKGCPHQKTGRAFVFDLGQVLDWRIAYEGKLLAETKTEELDRNQQAARKDAAQAEKLEMENAFRKGEFLLTEEVRAMNAEVAGVIRSNMLAIPSRLAGELSGVDEPREIQVVLDDAIRRALSSLEDDS